MAKSIRKSCQVCGKPFWGRKDAKTCSPTCRKRLQRSLKLRAIDEAKRLEEDAKRIEAAVKEEVQRLAAGLFPEQVAYAGAELEEENSLSSDDINSQQRDVPLIEPGTQTTNVTEHIQEIPSVQNIVVHPGLTATPTESTNSLKVSGFQTAERKPLKEDAYRETKSFRSLKWAVLTIFLLLGAGLILSLMLGRSNQHGLRQLNNSQQSQNQVVLRRQTSVYNQTSQLTVKVKALNARINNLKVSTNSNTYFVSTNTATSNAESNTLTSSQVLGSDVTLAGNIFNGPNQLVQLDSSGELPSVDGSNLIAVDATTLQGNNATYYTDASNLSSGTISDSLLSSNVALLDADNIFTAPNTFESAVVLSTLGSAGNTALCLNGSNQLASCTSGGGSGVNSLDGLVGALDLSNSSPGIGNNIVIDNASTTQRGLTEYGSIANTAAQGDTDLSFTGSGNLQGTVSGTSGGGFTANTLALVDSPILTGSLTIQGSNGIIIGSSTHTGTINFLDGTSDSFSASLGLSTTLSGNENFALPSSGGTLCTTLSCGGGASGSAGGDLTGSYPNPTIASLQGATLTISSITSGQVLQYNGSAIVNDFITNSNLSSGNFSNITGVGVLTGLSSSGTVTFSGLGSGVVQATSGVLSAGSVALGTETTGNYVANLGTLTGLTTTANSGAGSTPTLTVSYGSTSGTAAQGNSALSFTGSGNLTGTVSGTAGGNFTANTLAIVPNPSFTGTLTDSNSSGTALDISGTPQTTAGTSLIQVGSTAIASGTSSASGTYIGINEPSSGAGSAADFLNFQNNGTKELEVTSSGALTTNSTLTVNTGGLTVTGNSTINGTLGSLTGLSSSGTVTFSGLGSGVVQATSGVLSAGSVALGTETTGNYVANLGTLTGLTTTANSGAGSTPTLTVSYGSTSGTAAQGNSALSFTGSGNLTGTVSGTAGGNFTANTLAIVPNPSFTGTLTDSNSSGTALDISGTPQTTAGTSLIQVGSTAIASGTSSASGTYIGINEPSSGAGSAADFLNFQNNGTKELEVTSSGALTTNSTLTVNTGGLTVTGNSTINGTLGSLTGLSSSGTVTFSGLGSGVVQATSGVLSAGSVALGTETTGNYVANLGTLTGLTTTANSGAGSTPTLTVSYGSTSGTAAQGNSALSFTGSGNLTGTVSGTAGGNFTANTLAIVPNPSFTGTLTDSNSSGTALDISGTPQTTAGTSLIQVGSTAIASGTSSASGTYIGINEPSSGAGSAADFLNFQNNGTKELEVTSSGALTTNSTLTVNTGGASITGNVSVLNTVNSTTAFQVQNTSSQSVLQLDTLDSNLNIGSLYTTLPTIASGGTGTLTFSTTTPLGTSCGSAVYGEGSVAYNGYIYAIGGDTGGTTAITTVCYASLNGSTGAVGTWAATTNLPSSNARYNATTVVNNGYVYVIGGTNGITDQTTVYYAQLNSGGGISSAGWGTTTSLPIALEQATSVVSNGYIYELGGSNNGTIESSVYYAPLNSNGTLGNWNITTAFPSALGPNAGAASAVNNGYIYEMGGSNTSSCTSNNPSSLVYYASINANGTIGAWISTDQMSNGRQYASAITWGSYVYDLGGTGSGGGCGAAASDNENAQLSTNGSISSWNNLTASGLTQDWQAADIAYNGYVYQIGGTTSSTGASGLSTVQYASLSGSQGTSGSGGQNINLSVNGSVAIQAGANTPTAFTIQNASGVNLIGVDTLNTIVSLGVTGTTATASTINIGTSTGAGQTINEGSSNTGSTITLQGGGSKETVTNTGVGITGNLVANNNFAVSGTSTFSGNVIVSNSDFDMTSTPSSTAAFQIQNSTASELQLDTLDGDLNVGTAYTTLPSLGTGGGTVGVNFAATTSLGSGSNCGAPDYGASAVISPTTFFNGTAFNIGGDTSTGASSTVCYDTMATGFGGGGSISSWTSTTSLLTPLYNATAVAYGGYVYVMGGATTGDVDQTAVYSAQVTSSGIGSWTTLSSTPLPVALEQATSVVNNGYVYVIGGASSGTVGSTVYYAQLGSNGTIGSWHTTTSLPVATTGAVSFVSGGYIYEAGGGSSATTCAGSTYGSVYYATINANGTIGSWTATTSMSSVSVYTKYASAETYDGYVYILGGVDATGSCNTNSGTITDISAPLNTNGTISSGTWSVLNGPPNDYFLSSSFILGTFIDVIGGTSTGSNFKASAYWDQITGTQPSSGSGGQNINLSVNGATSIQTQINTAAALTVQNSTGSNVLAVDTVNTDVSTNGQLLIKGGLSVSGLSVPSAPSVLPGQGTGGSTGTTSYQYRVSAVNAAGNYTAASAIGVTTAGSNSALSSTNYNKISWAGVSSASEYYVYRVVDGLNSSMVGYVGTILSNSSTNNTYTFNDIGTTPTDIEGATSTTPYPIYDTSGQLTANGDVLLQNATNSTVAFQIQNQSDQDVVQVDTTGNNVNVDTGTPGLNSWQTNSSNPVPTGLTGSTSVVYNGYVYVIGGGTGIYGNFPQSTVYYAQLNANGSTGPWQTNIYAIGCTTGGCASPTALDYATAVVYNGYVYVIGGNTGGSSSQSTVYYAQLNANGSTGPWQTNIYAIGCTTGGCASPTALAYATSAAYNGYVYIMGGSTSTSATPQSTVYYAQLNANGSTGPWQTNSYAIGCTTGGCGGDPSNFSTAAVYDGYVYIMGGDSASENIDGTPLNTVYYAQLNTSGTGVTGSWQSTTLPNGPLENATSSVLGGYLYLMGGDNQGGENNALSSVYYTQLSASGGISGWNVTTGLPPTSTGIEGASSIAYNGYVYEIGGNNTSSPLPTVYYTNIGALTVQSQAVFNTGLNSLGNLVVQGQANFAQNAAFAQDVSIAGSLSVAGSATFTGSIVANGSVLVQSTTNSPTAFQVENSSGSSLIVADTTYGHVGIGMAPASSGATLQVSGTINIAGTGSSLSINGTQVCSSTMGSGSTPGCSGGTSGGSISTNTSGSPQTANFYIQNNVGSANIIEAAASGSSDLLDFDNGSGTKVAYFDSNGDLTLANNLTVNGASSLTGATTFTGTSTEKDTSATAFQIQNSSGTTLLLADTNSSGSGNQTIEVEGASSSSFATFQLNNAHFYVSQSTTPGISLASSGCGTSPSDSDTGSTDAAGFISFTAGTSTAAGCTITITYAATYGTNPTAVIITPTNSTDTSLADGPYVSGNNASSFTIAFNTKPVASTNYSYYYWVVAY